jgi:hypothetical protein
LELDQPGQPGQSGEPSQPDEAAPQPDEAAPPDDAQSRAGAVENEPVVVPVTVLVPSYRRKTYLARALASVAAQVGVRPLEVVVIDDASHDGTAELAASLGARVIEKDVNEGLSTARDDGLRAAEGAQWVALLDDDDIWLPHHLQTLWSQRDGHVMVAGTSVTIGDSAPRYHGAPSGLAEVVRSPARLIFPENSFTASAVLVQRDLLLAVGGFDRRLRYLEDLDAWLRLLEHGTGLLLPEVTCLYSTHGGQMSKDQEAMLASLAATVTKYGERAWMTPQLRQNMAVVEAWDSFQSARSARDWGGVAQKGAWLVARPSRLDALVSLWRFRHQVRRRAATIDPRYLAALSTHETVD